MCIYIETVFSKPFINLHSQFMWCGAIVFRKLTLGQDASMTEYTSHISKIISSVNPCTAVKINRTVRISNAVITINYTKNTITPLMFLHKHPHKSFSHKFSLHHPSSKIGDKKGLLTFFSALHLLLYSLDVYDEFEYGSMAICSLLCYQQPTEVPVYVKSKSTR